jgi:hypothetical protein
MRSRCSGINGRGYEPKGFTVSPETDLGPSVDSVLVARTVNPISNYLLGAIGELTAGAANAEAAVASM